MTNGKRQRQELKIRRLLKKERFLGKTGHKNCAAVTKVELTKLTLSYAYSVPEFVERGYYLDQPFTCCDCGSEEVWLAKQQQWWYEVMQADIWTKAVRCRACCIAERQRKSEARRIHLQGLTKKQTSTS